MGIIALLKLMWNCDDEFLQLAFAFTSSLLSVRLSAGIKRHRVRVAMVSAKPMLQASGPAARHILITLIAEGRLYYRLRSSLMCFEELPMLFVNSERRSFQGRVFRGTQRLLQDKERKWFPLRVCSTGPLAENVGPWTYQKEREGGKAIAPFVKPILGFRPCCPFYFPHPPHFSSVTIMK